MYILTEALFCLRTMKLLLLSIVLAVAQATIVDDWHAFKIEHGKTYPSFFDEMARFTTFQANLKEIEEHNAKFERGEVTYSMGINQFTDMTQQEFEATLGLDLTLPDNVKWYDDNETVGDENINWVEKGYVTPIRQQGTCGSCWAFSAAGALEAQVKKSTGQLSVLSTQNLLDCAQSSGCRGGTMIKAFQYVEDNGILKESEYPYEGVQKTCRKKGGPKISSMTILPRHEEDKLLPALTSKGPISVCIDCHKIKQYKGGIVTTQCGCTRNVNHGVLLVGAGSEKGKKYWLIKNSWGTTWGEKGYLKLERGSHTCGVDSLSVYPEI